jgi:phage baseplate assembly protein gpV
MTARLISLGVLAAMLAGFVVLVSALPKSAATIVGVAIPAFAVIAIFPRIGRPVLAALCAAVVGLLVLVVLAVVIRAALEAVGIDGRLPIPVGLALAVIVFFAVAFWYLHGPWLGAGAADAGPSWFVIPTPVGWNPILAAGAAAGLAFVVILVPPFVIGKLQQTSKAPVADEQEIVATIDALIVTDRPRAKASAAATARLARSGKLAPYAHAREFDVRYSVGFATAAGGVRWVLPGTGDEEKAIDALGDPDAAPETAPAPLDDADRVLLLVVDGTPPVVEDPAGQPSVDGVKGEIARWRGIARAAAPAGTTTYALLETTDPDRLLRWKASFTQRGTYVRRGGTVSLQGLGSQAVTDAAVRLAVAAPTAQEDYSLALTYRPILLFDTDEPAPRPLSVEALFDTKKVRLCDSDRARGTECNEIPDAKALKNGGTHLELPLPSRKVLKRLAKDDLARQEAGDAAAPPPPGSVIAPPPNTPPPAAPEPGAIGDGSAIYVHPVPADSEDERLLYLDYWWYVPYNTANSGSGAFCGPGFVIPGISCFDHVSDWEGVTVVLNRTAADRKPTVTDVHYAQHEGVVRVEWEKLRTAWAADKTATAVLAKTPDSATRPLVFVASGTHASYPLPCTKKPKCKQTVGGAEENEHDGGLPWSGNTAATCGEDPCLRMLPTARGGRDPALWNAFTGLWGTRHCFLTYYCDSSAPPAAPGQQDRYEAPWASSGTFEPKG